MARGAARFDAQILHNLRASRPVSGRLLSAHDLAKRVGTSKARILAYEKGTSVPEPGRVAQLAAVYGVPTRELYEPIPVRQMQLRDLRGYAGLTAAEVASRLSISRTTYRDIELHAILPARDDGTLPLRLADVLGHPLPMVHRALDNHPQAELRRIEIATHLESLFARARLPHVPAVVNPDEPGLLAIAQLLRRPIGVVCRLVNYELSLYRSMLKEHAQSEIEGAYAQTSRDAREAKAEAARLTERISEASIRSASSLVRFLAEAMNSRQWRIVVRLLEGETFAEPLDTDLAEVWPGLVARKFVAERPDTIGPMYMLTTEGLIQCRGQIGRYGCLYARVAAPRRIAYGNASRSRRAIRRSSSEPLAYSGKAYTGQ
jgi:transcriptional regulator with XRE-family HTH domain